MNKGKSTLELQFQLAQYDSTFDDFGDMLVVYGFLLLFVAVFPLAPLLTLVSNAVELSVDSYKLCNLTQRPEPKSACSVGMWQYVFQVCTSIAIAVTFHFFLI